MERRGEWDGDLSGKFAVGLNGEQKWSFFFCFGEGLGNGGWRTKPFLFPFLERKR